MWASLSCGWGPGRHKGEHEPRTGIRLALLPDRRLGVTSSLPPCAFPTMADRTRVIPSFLSRLRSVFCHSEQESDWDRPEPGNGLCEFDTEELSGEAWPKCLVILPDTKIT